MRPGILDDGARWVGLVLASFLLSLLEKRIGMELRPEVTCLDGQDSRNRGGIFAGERLVQLPGFSDITGWSTKPLYSQGSADIHTPWRTGPTLGSL